MNRARKTHTTISFVAFVRFLQREKIIEQNEKRKGQLNLMLFETRGKIADHNTGRSVLDEEVSTANFFCSLRCVHGEIFV
jgi:hypothetical protein